MVKTSTVQMNDAQDVAAIVTAMTDGEQPFLFETLKAVLSDPCIGQVLLCVENTNVWLETTIGYLITDPRLQIVKFPLLPPGAVRNKALNNVQKSWVTYCDGDDVWLKGKTISQRTLANSIKCDFVGADHYLIDEEGKICAFALASNLPMTSSWMVRTEIMKQYPFNEELGQGSDGEWWMRTVNDIPKVRCPKMLIGYRVRPDSVSSSTSSKQRKTKIVAMAKIPVLGLGVFIFTYFAWFLTKKNQYVWSPDWEKPDLVIKN